MFIKCFRTITPMADNIEYRISAQKKPKPADAESCEFGREFTDHMLIIPWKRKSGWHRPLIQPLDDIRLHPAASVLHYAVELFEGMKAYKTENNRVVMFRPKENMRRMAKSAERACLPTFDEDALLKCISELIRIDQDWIPASKNASLYVRPTLIGTEPALGVKAPDRALFYCILSPVGAYFQTPGTLSPISLLADPRYIRAFEGGVGAYKLGSNYGPTIWVQNQAMERDCHQVLWLYGADHQLTEVGTMNLFVFWVNEKGDRELATMPLNMGLVLPGITRQSIIELARRWNEFDVVEKVFTMSDIMKALDDERLFEMFGSGTASVICPIERIVYQNLDLIIPFRENCESLAVRLHQELTDIQYGRVPHEWTYAVVGCR